MEITGKIIQVLPEVGGVSKAGNEMEKTRVRIRDTRSISQESMLPDIRSG